MILLGQMSFAAPLPWTSETVYGWARNSIRGIRLRTDIGGSFCCAPAGTIDLSIDSNSCLLMKVNTPLSQLSCFLGLVVHETRHNNGFIHTCGSNDQTLAELGAWGVQYHFFDYLVNHTDRAFISASAASQIGGNLAGLCSRFCAADCPPR
jgi:hypothetical protein